MQKYRFWSLILVFLCISLIQCKSLKPVPVVVKPIDTVVISKPILPVMKDRALTSNWMDSFLANHAAEFDHILKNKKKLNVQIIYTQIDRGKNGQAALKNYYFNLDDSCYFYPASTVKFPVSILALQRLRELDQPNLDRSSTMLTGANFSGQTEVLNDPTTPNGNPSIEHYIKKILMVSDNDAYNRLYEFLGPAYINQQMAAKGYPKTQIIHRLSIPLTEEENRHTNPIQFQLSNGQIFYQQPGQYNNMIYPTRNDSLGKGYMQADQLVPQPMNFSKKNRFPLQDLHQVLVSLIFPYRVTASQRFNITEEDRRFLLKYMSQLPTESTYPPYSADTANYYPGYCKFLLVGGGKDAIPPHMRIFNKVGDAYGQLIDAAYIVDFDKKVEFFLSATIYCNEDGILNDDKYDYETIGYPFMKALGKAIYQYELGREKAHLPDLSEFIFEYDKH